MAGQDRQHIRVWLGMAVFFFLTARLRWTPVSGESLRTEFHWDSSMSLWLPPAFLLAALYAWLRSRHTGARLAPATLLELGLSLACVGFLHVFLPVSFVDDAGFILRYWDHFAEGCFYCYNVQDGPVFGISSFVYGLLGGVISWTGLLSPEGTMYFLTYLGVFTTAWLSLRLLRHLIASPGMALLAWLLFMTLNRSMLVIFNSGMETPVHLSIILGALLALVRGYDRTLWFLLALAVISKLDAVPLVLVTGTCWALLHRQDLRPLRLDHPRVQAVIRWGAAPVLLWIAFSTWVFGSPLPQSAYSKMYYMAHARGYWFPFIEGFFASPLQKALFWGSIALHLVHSVWVVLRRQDLKQVVPGFCFLGTLALYYVYNPGERMLWYYVMPEALMLLQLGLSLDALARAGGRRVALAGGLLLGGVFWLLWPRMADELRFGQQVRVAVDAERTRIGAYLGSMGRADDTLSAGHGLTSRPFPGYVVDETGLNFRIPAEISQDALLKWQRYRPNWIAMHGFSWEVDKLNSLPYVLDTAFFEICTHEFPAWRVFRRVPALAQAQRHYFIGEGLIQGPGLRKVQDRAYVHVEAQAFDICLAAFVPLDDQISLGLSRFVKPYTVRVQDCTEAGAVLWENAYRVAPHAGAPPYVFPLTIPLNRGTLPGGPPAGKRIIRLRFEGNLAPVHLFDPLISVRNS